MLKPWRLHGCVATTRHFIFFIFYQRHKVKEYSFRLYSAGRHGRQSGSRGRSYRPRPKNTHTRTHISTRLQLRRGRRYILSGACFLAHAQTGNEWNRSPSTRCHSVHIIHTSTFYTQQLFIT